MRTIVFLTLVCAGNLLKAQNNQLTEYSSLPIKIDTLTKRTSAPLPFDKTFILQYDLKKGQALPILHIYKVVVQKKVRQIYRLGKDYNDQFLDTVLLNENTMNIFMKYLPPNTLVDILMVERLTDTEFQPLLELNEKLYKNKMRIAAFPRNILENSYKTFIGSLTSKQYSNFNRVISKPNFARYDSLYEFALHANYLTLHNLTYNTNLPIFDTTSFSKMDSLFRKYEINNKQLAQLFRVYATSNGISDLSLGKFKVGDIDIKENPVIDEEYFKRSANLKATKKTLDSLLFLLDQARLISPFPNTLDFREKINKLKVAITDNYDKISMPLEKVTSLMTDSTSFILLTRPDGSRLYSWICRDSWIISGNNFADLLTKSKFLLVPDLGITTMLIGGRNKVYVVPRPFIGTNIYFRPVDKNLPNNEIPYSDWRRKVSLQFGLTYGDFDEQEFSNLFNNFSLLVGPSLKLNRSFRLSSGAVLYRTSDKNPLITKQHLGAGFYFAFSFDLDILSNSGVTKRLTP